ncbi:hypothetical protein GCM10010978_24520 [Compostibacillus humi]|jgi:hypothetical protein|uniref:YlzJ-like protein n=1 Tax=Compostibacillus humi TaxID=1245525 RepID=A0A8J2XGB1_9BACI|nr:YlzJ-like family protein [Compostibacillus humi]GFZ82982.1 hypothetical protein GCM10010978_24520 [Compostibacillus humi]HLT56825.1 YlzJ-like family protein [Bacillota bacterium]
MLYTPLDYSEIFPPSDEEFANRKYVNHEGKLFVIDKTEEGTYQLVQLISSNPHDYLNNDYLPGTTLT